MNELEKKILSLCKRPLTPKQVFCNLELKGEKRSYYHIVRTLNHLEWQMYLEKEKRNGLTYYVLTKDGQQLHHTKQTKLH